MKKVSERQRRFFAKKGKMGIRRLRKRKKYKRQHTEHSNNEKSIKAFMVPPHFSIIENPLETLAFFEGIISYRRKNNTRSSTVRLDFRDVEKIGVEALMYLIAIMNDTSKNENIKFEGSFPKNSKAHETLINSGFTDYVQVNAKEEIRPKVNNIRIEKGTNVDPVIASKISMFIQQNFDIDGQKTNIIYNTIVELMENTRHHAYDENYERSPKSWYIFSGYGYGEIVIIFLDTGLGIPHTVRKNIKDYLTFNYNNDMALIKSTLNGDWRTETKKRNRGKGLPKIAKSCMESNLVKELYVCSGKGICVLSESISGRRCPYKMHGTLYSIRIKDERR